MLPKNIKILSVPSKNMGTVQKNFLKESVSKKFHCLGEKWKRFYKNGELIKKWRFVSIGLDLKVNIETIEKKIIVVKRADQVYGMNLQEKRFL